MLAGFVVSPLLLRWLGDERVGLYRAAAEWFAVVAILDFGFQMSFQTVAAKARLGPVDQTPIVLRVGLKLFTRITVVILLAGIGLTLVMPALTSTPAELVTELRIGCVLCLVSGFLVLLTPFRLILEASQEGYLVQMGLLAQTAISNVLMVYLAWSGWGLPGQFLAVGVANAAIAFGFTRLGLRRYPGVFRRASDAGPEQEQFSAELRRLNRPTLLWTLCHRLSSGAEILLASFVLGPVAVTAYALTTRPLALVAAQVAMINSATWASLAELSHTGESERLRHRFVELTKYVTILGLAGGIPVAVFSRDFLRLWVGDERYAGDAVIGLTLLTSVLLPIRSLWTQMFTGVGRVTVILPLSLWALGVQILGGVVGVYLFGMPGLLLGAAASSAGATAVWLPFLLWRHFGITPATLLRAVGSPVAAAIPLAAGTLALGANYRPDGWAELIACLTGCSAVFVLVGWLLLLTPSERAEWRRRLPGGRKLPTPPPA
jgi:O-antigen/teichoic acid export membrane protein